MNKNCTESRRGDIDIQWSGGFSGSLSAAYLIQRGGRLAGAPGFNQEDDKFGIVFSFTVAAFT